MKMIDGEVQTKFRRSSSDAYDGLGSDRHVVRLVSLVEHVWIPVFIVLHRPSCQHAVSHIAEEGLMEVRQIHFCGSATSGTIPQLIL